MLENFQSGLRLRDALGILGNFFLRTCIFLSSQAQSRTGELSDE